jgi:hypothetical protein
MKPDIGLKVGIIRTFANMRRYLLVLLASVLLTSFVHPFYTSVTEVEYNSKTKELGIACKMFPDDLEETLRLYTGKKFDLYKNEKQLLNPILEAYFKKHVAILINEKARPYSFLGYEIDKEVVWLYFNMAKLSGVRSIEVQSNLMYEYKAEQTNIVHIDLDGKKQSYKLMAPAISAKLSTR